jgi:hypothetical protein
MDYQKLLRHVAEEMSYYCPQTWKIIAGKRYILPQYRTPDYWNQELCDGVMALFLSAYFGCEFGEKPNSVLNACYMNYALAILENRPVYYLEKELGEALMRTQLPKDLSADDLHWRRRQMRIMLPSGLLSIERDGLTQSLMYLDIGKMKASQQLFLTPVSEEEMNVYARLRRIAEGKPLHSYNVRPIFEREGIVISGQLNPPPDTFGLDYGLMRPLDSGLSIGELIQIGGAYETESPCDADDDLFLARMQHLAFNILIFMGSVPMEYDQEKLEQIRKMRVENERVIPGLFNAKFVGRSQYRPSHRPQYVRPATSTGRHMAQHWVAGHWKRQAYGAHRAQRKLIWLQPYETAPPPEEETKLTRAS